MDTVIDKSHLVVNKAINFYNNHNRVSNTILGISLLYFVNKIYKKWKYSLKLFTSSQEIKNKVILITGCGHGIGNALALKLSLSYGYKVISTCRTQQSVDEFLSNNSFKSNGSTSIVMDVTNNNDIENVKEFLIEYLNDTNSNLWGIVNNAGCRVAGDFELVQPKTDAFERNVLFNGPLNIIRTFLPLIQGRKNYKPKDVNNKLQYRSDGGRIVNISSVSGRHRTDNTRYGVCKAALSYFTHSLRRELSPRFGIWCSVIEPGGFITNFVSSFEKWTDAVIQELKENKKEELIDIYEFDMNVIMPNMNKLVNDTFATNLDPVINDIIHALIAKYPEPEYIPGSNFIYTLMEYLPIWILDQFDLAIRKQIFYNK